MSHHVPPPAFNTDGWRHIRMLQKRLLSHLYHAERTQIATLNTYIQSNPSHITSKQHHHMSTLCTTWDQQRLNDIKQEEIRQLTSHSIRTADLNRHAQKELLRVPNHFNDREIIFHLFPEYYRPRIPRPRLNRAYPPRSMRYRQALIDARKKKEDDDEDDDEDEDEDEMENDMEDMSIEEKQTNGHDTHDSSLTSASASTTSTITSISISTSATSPSPSPSPSLSSQQRYFDSTISLLQPTSTHSSSVPTSTYYPLTKLLIIATVRAIEKLYSSQSLQQIYDRQERIRMAAGLSSQRILESKHPIDNTINPDGIITSYDIYESKHSLLQRFLSKITDIKWETYENVDKIIDKIFHEGKQLTKISLNVDRDAKMILFAEPYSLTSDNLTPTSTFTSACRQFLDRAERTWCMDKINPLENLKFTLDPQKLANEGRTPCPKCKRNCHLYCPYDFSIALSTPGLTLPKVTLPVSFDILHHPQENIKKSTSIHACVLAPTQVRFLEFPIQIPTYSATDTVLLYPTTDAIYLDDPHLDFSSIKRVVVIESTWQKGAITAAHHSLAHLKHIRIRDKESTFWRYQELGSQYLSTLEAIYWTSVEYIERQKNSTVIADTSSTTSTTSTDTATSASTPSDAQANGHTGTSTEASASASAPSTSTSTSSTTSSSSSTSPSSRWQYDGSFDDLLLMYAFQHSRIVKRYDTDKVKPPPKSWKPQRVKLDGQEHKQTKQDGIMN